MPRQATLHKVATTKDENMTKSSDTGNFNRIMAGLTEVAEITQGKAEPARVYVPDTVDVRSIRAGLGLSQPAFAAQFGFNVASVREWEQHRRTPEAAARILLRIIEREPDAVRRALAQA